MITLKHEIDGAPGADIALPQMSWVNEFAWSPVARAPLKRTLTGIQIWESSEKFGGRPIELRGWMDRATLKAVRDLLVLDLDPDAQMFVDLHGQAIYVRFAVDGPAIEAEPLVDYAEPDDGDFYRSVTLRFIEF